MNKLAKLRDDFEQEETNKVICHAKNNSFADLKPFLLPPELVDHCAVWNVETFANFLEKKDFFKAFELKSPEVCGDCLQDICKDGESPTHQERPG